ncbi:thioredoxin family protein [uncultured Maribacter sp.]|uniref:thioredoxin family protein n=1 Tax=uncultured Maribacter sp. TaxID=431308 RepID=UPI00262875D2|nr:thioredoxin family protein [uncultured Maribacter sp.]
MKRFLILLLFPVLLSAQGDLHGTDDVKWLTNYDKALKKAKKEHKNVLVYFTGSDWCPPCKKLKKDLFETTEFSEISKDYILLYVDIPRNKDLLTKEQLKHNYELASKYNEKNTVPLLKILDSKGSSLDEYSGYSMTGETQYHIELLKKHQ